MKTVNEDQSKNYFDETYELLKQYTEDRLLLLKIQTAKKTAKLTSKLVLIFISAILLFFILLFISMMLGYFFAEKTGSMFYGFAIVVGIYFFLFLIFLAVFKNYFSKKIMDMITNIFFESNEELNIIDDEE